jgi:hypothetical protein
LQYNYQPVNGVDEGCHDGTDGCRCPDPFYGLRANYCRAADGDLAQGAIKGTVASLPLLGHCCALPCQAVDQGSQYTREPFQALMKDNGVAFSMS